MEQGTRGVFRPNPRPADYIARTGPALMLRPETFYNNASDLTRLLDYVKAQAPFYARIAAPTVIITGDSDDIVLEHLHSQGLARDIAGSGTREDLRRRTQAGLSGDRRRHRRDWKRSQGNRAISRRRRARRKSALRIGVRIGLSHPRYRASLPRATGIPYLFHRRPSRGSHGSPLHEIVRPGRRAVVRSRAADTGIRRIARARSKPSMAWSLPPSIWRPMSASRS